MKAQFIRIGIALVAMSSCLALAQDKDHDRDDQHHRHATHHRVVVTTNTHYRRVPGGHQTITRYNYHRMRTGRRHTTVIVDQSRPWYHPKRRYSDADWDARVKAARRRHHHHHMSWSTAVIRSGHRRTHHTVVVRTVRHNNGLHRGWYIGKGNPHRAGSHHRDGDKDHDNDKDHGHGHPLALNNSGFVLASWQSGYQNNGYQKDGYQNRRYQHRQGSYHRRLTRGMYAAGHYTSVARWTRNGNEFVIRYVINLSSEGHARLEATSLQDRNMPNNDANTDPHGDILRYMHTGHDVIQTGNWRQDGNDITIHLTQIEYGHTVRSKSETLRAHVAGNTLVVDSYDSNFYGDRLDTTFRKD